MTVQKKLRKETLIFIGDGTMSSLIIPEAVVEIEYGTLLEALGTESIYLGASQLFEASKSKDGFLNGDCRSLPEGGCKICLMHQYGMNSKKIQSERYCDSGANVSIPEEMKRCFWKPLPKFDQPEIRDNDIVKRTLEKYRTTEVCSDESFDSISSDKTTSTSEEPEIVTMEPVWQPSNSVNLHRDHFKDVPKFGSNSNCKRSLCICLLCIYLFVFIPNFSYV